MALTTKLHSSFWSDEDVGRLAPEGKLAIVWLLTNKDMNNIGYLKVSRRQFSFDTGLPPETLQGALKGLPRGFRFEETDGGLMVLAVNYVGYQFGDHTLTEKNHITKHLCNLLAGLSEGFRECVLSRYETLARVFRVLRPLQAPYKGDIRDQNSTAQYSTAEHSEGSLRGNSPQAEIAFPVKNSGEKMTADVAENGAAPFHVEQKTPVKSGLRYDLADEVLRFLNEKAGTAFLPTPAMSHDIAMRLHQVGNDVMGVKKMVARQVSMWAGNGKMQEFLRPATLFHEEKFANYWGQRDLALPAGDAAARAVKLHQLIEESRANRSSSYWSSEATAEEKEQLQKWRAELRDLKGAKAA